MTEEQFEQRIEYFNIATDIIKNIFIGLACVLLFIFLNNATGFSIGLPLLPQATAGERLAYIGGVAPLAEESAFHVLYSVLNIFLPVYIAVPIRAVSFGVFHLFAYSGSFSLYGLISSSGALIAAAVFGLWSVLLIEWRKSILPSIILHVGANLYLFNKYSLQIFGLAKTVVLPMMGGS